MQSAVQVVLGGSRLLAAPLLQDEPCWLPLYCKMNQPELAAVAGKAEDHEKGLKKSIALLSRGRSFLKNVI